MIKQRTIEDAWRMALWHCARYGYDFVVEKGSYEGQIRRQLDSLSVVVDEPYTRPLAVTLPEHLGIPAPTSDERIHQYFYDYLVTDTKTDKEDYTYGSFISKQAEFVVDLLNMSEGNTNQACITIGDPSSIVLKDPPCLKLVDFKVVLGRLNMTVFFRCLHGDTSIVVNTGDSVRRITVEELYSLSIGENSSSLSILSVDDNYNPIWGKVSFVDRSYSSKIKTIDIVGGGSLKITEDHKVCTSKKEATEICLKEVKDITVDDYLLEVCNFPSYKGAHNDYVDLVDLFRESKDIFVCDLPLKYFSILRKNGISFSRHYVDRRCLPINKVIGSSIELEDDLKVKAKNSNKVVKNRKCFISDEFAFFMGLWLADGWYNHTNTSLRLVINSSKPAILERVNNFLQDEFGYTPSIEERRGCYCLNISIKLLVQMFNEFGFIQGATIKYIPAFVYSLSDSKARHFIDGWFSGDAGVSSSKSLVLDFIYLMKKLGIQSSLYTQDPRQSLHRIDGRLITSHNKSYRVNPMEGGNNKIAGSLRKRKVKHISETCEKDFVYDIGVDTDSHLIACGDIPLLMHNSWDIFAAFPENIGGLQLLKEYVLMHLKFPVEDGQIFAYSSGAHIYEQYFPIVNQLNAHKCEVLV